MAHQSQDKDGDVLLNVLEKYKDKMKDQDYINGIEALGRFRNNKTLEHYKIRFCIVQPKFIPSDDLVFNFHLSAHHIFHSQVFSLSKDAYSKIRSSTLGNWEYINNVSHWCNQFPELRKVQQYLNHIGGNLYDTRRIIDRWEHCRDDDCQNINHFSTPVKFKLYKSAMIIDISAVNDSLEDSETLTISEASETDEIRVVIEENNSQQVNNQENNPSQVNNQEINEENS